MKKTKEIKAVRNYIMNEDDEYRVAFFSKDEIEEEYSTLGVPFVTIHGMPAIDLNLSDARLNDRNRAFLVQKEGDRPSKVSVMLQIAKACKKGLLSQNDDINDIPNNVRDKHNTPYNNLSNVQY